jgi:sensor histidine kinase YesM
MKNDKKAAYLYLTRLSALLRASLRERTSLLKPLSEEIDFIRNYCELQKLRFGDRFNYKIEIKEGVNLNKELPKMTIQTFVENAIKHGIETRKTGGMVEILISHVNEYHIITVRDNGIGRTASLKNNSGGTGYGIVTVNRIFEILNNKNFHKSVLEIKDLVENNIPCGTEVTISIPDKYSFKVDDLPNGSSYDDILV